MHFLIQREGGFLSEDCATIKECIDECNWLNGENYYTMSFADLEHIPAKEDNTIPVGSIEFVEAYMRKRIVPLLIPAALRGNEFTHRKICVSQTIEDIEDFYTRNGLCRAFVKSASICKCDFTDMYRFGEIAKLPNHPSYFVSEEIDIKSEWRIFVRRGSILGVKHYSGDPWIIPDRDMVNRMVNTYTDAPPAYTLDVGIAQKADNLLTAVIEVHNFISCGLYGFHSTKIPSMLASAYLWEAKNDNYPHSTQNLR